MPDRSIVIIEDEPVMRRALAGYLAGTGRWLVYGSASTLKAAQTLISGAAKAVDVVLLDIKLETEWGLDLIPWLKSQNGGGPVPAVAVYTSFSDMAHVNAALSLGVRGYIIKKRDEAELEAALDAMLKNGEWIDGEAERPPAAPGSRLTVLTKRESEVLSLVKAGLVNKEIAARLGITSKTSPPASKKNSTSPAFGNCKRGKLSLRGGGKLKGNQYQAIMTTKEYSYSRYGIGCSNVAGANFFKNSHTQSKNT